MSSTPAPVWMESFAVTARLLVLATREDDDEHWDQSW
jgi:hypothetical protein